MLFTFPSRYSYTIGLSVVFSLTGWAPQIPAEFLVLRGTQVPARKTVHFDYGTVTRYGRTFQNARLWTRLAKMPVLQHRGCLDSTGLGSCAFARHYLRNRCYFLFLWVLRCFSSPRSPLAKGQVTASPPPGSPIRTSPGRSAFAAHRRFSQLVTSFFASESHRHPPCALDNFPCFFSPKHLSISCLRSIFSVFLYFSIRFDFGTQRHKPPKGRTPGRRNDRRQGGDAHRSSRSQHVNDLKSGG